MKRKKLKQKTERLEARDSENDLLAFIEEADFVEQMKISKGWEIICRDFSNHREQCGGSIPYLNKNTKEFEESVLKYRAIDMLFKLIEDYEVNKAKSLELLEKIRNPEENIVLDVDN